MSVIVVMPARGRFGSSPWIRPSPVITARRVRFPVRHVLLASQFASRPAWLLDVPDNELASVETLPGGDRYLIDEIEDDGQRRVTVIVSRPTRLSSVSTPEPEMSLRMASALR